MTGRNALAALLLVTLALPVRGQTSRGDGSQTGDGSTPFTGLAQAPEASMFVGAATTTIPIQVPPGHKNLTPKLALSYSSDAGPSPYGYGWDLSLPHMQRAAKRGAWTCGSDRDEFVLTLPGASIECTLQPGGRCTPHAEEAFVKIVATEAYDDTAYVDRITWNVWDKSGIHYTFGGPSASVDGGASFDTAARTGDDGDRGTAGCGYAATWALTSIQDTTNNRLDVRYLLVQGVLYPASIQYGGNGSFAHQFQVTFQWEGRDDRLEIGSGGTAAVLTQRLARIDVQVRPSQPVPVRSYAFTYAPDRVGRQTFLESVLLAGADGTVLLRADHQPAASTFLYHAKTVGFAAAAQARVAPALRRPLNGLGTNPGVLRWTDADDGTRRDVLDMNGDGIPDLVDAWPIHDLSDGCSGSTAVDHWDVYLGSAAGFAPAAAQWYVPQRGLMCDLRRSGATLTSMTTVDLTGDGIPDFVDARTTPWTVYPGTPHSPYSPGGTGWGFGAPISWTGSYPIDTQLVRTGATIGNSGSANNWNGSMVRQDLIDMNGDGRLDLVKTPGADEPITPTLTNWTVWLNTGTGFAAAQTFQGMYQALSFQSTDSNENGMVYGTFDVNGDGLPDQVLSQHARAGSAYTGGWSVCLNSGHAMDTCAQWNLPNVGNWRNITHVLDSEPQDRNRDFFDINGDGLPDVVEASGSSGTGSWQVFLNRGDGFEQQALAWPAPSVFIRNGSPGGGQTLADTFDVDGDGLVDFVDFTGAPYAIYHAADGAWAASGYAASENAAGMHPDLLVASENGVGSTTYLQYRPSTQWDNTGGDGIPDLPFNTWTVTEIRHDDGLCEGGSCVNPGSAHEVGATYTYTNGRYDPLGRAFRGFGTVASEALADTATAHLGTLTYFHQTAAFLGKIQDQWSYDASYGSTNLFQPISRTSSTWECADPTSGAAITCPSEPAGDVWVRLKDVTDYSFSNFSPITFERTTTTNIAWHQCNGKFYGNVQDVSQGNGIVLHTHTDYGCSDDDTHYLVDRPIHVVVRDTSNKPLEEKWFYYDRTAYGQLGAQGQVTMTLSWLDHSNTGSPPACGNTPAAGYGGCVGTGMKYDGFGNIIGVIDALGRTTATAYDATAVYPVTVTQPAPFSYTVSRQYDPGCGTLLLETIPHKPSASTSSQTVHHYDAFCRRTQTWRPGEPTSDVPYRKYTYALGAPGSPTATFTYSHEPNHANEYVTTAVLADALGRVIEQKSDGEVDGATAYLATATQYDGQGRVRQQSVPFVWGSSTYAPFFTYTDAPGATGETVFQYDAVGRPITQTNPDGTRRLMNYSVAWETDTADECLQASCPGSYAVETRDALGHVATRKWYDGAGNNAHLLAGLQFGYDEEGKLLTTTQADDGGTWNSHTTVTTTYDTLGRTILVKDQDSRITTTNWQSGYDLAGNLLYQNDPTNNQHLEYCYDALNRVTKKFILTTGDTYTAKSCAAAANVSYTYNESQTIGLGRLASVTDLAGTYSVLAYDVLGRVLHERRTIDVDNDVTTAEMRYTYDAGDHLTTLTYPDGEAVTYSYDGVGRVNSLTGTEAYLINLTYDLFGRPRKIIHPNGVEDERTYGDTSSNYRLAQIRTTVGSTNPTTLLQYAYVSYDADGRLTTLNDLSPSHGPNGVLDNGGRYTYDALGRLVRAQGPQLGTRQYLVNALDDLTLKDGVPLTYDTAHPHELLTYNGQAVAHDDDGDRNAKPGHTYRYDVEGHLTDVDGQETFRYDFTGRRAVRQTAAGAVTRYYNNLFEADSDETITKYYVAGALLIATIRKSNAQFATAGFDAAVRLAKRSLLDRAAVVLVLRRDVQIGLAAVVLFGGTALFVAPWRRRRRVVGVALRPGRAIGAALLIAAALPWPIVLLPESAEGQCSETPIATHYHLDHLGSTQLITYADSQIAEWVRYAPYGEVRGRYDGVGRAVAPYEGYRREFTGYETDFASGLEYAGARFYDPMLGMFLTHDPAGQASNPYTYTNWDPVNRTDPTGAFWDLVLISAIIGSVLAATASGIQAAVNGASVGNIFKAAAIGQGIGAVSGALSAAVLQPALVAIVGPILSSVGSSASADVVAGYVMIGAGIGQSAYGLSAGDYVNGSIGLAAAGVGVYLALSQGANGAAGRAKASADQQPTDATLSELDLHPGDVLGTNQGSIAHSVGTIDPTGDIGHTEEVLPEAGGEIQVLTSDQRGQVTAGVGDSAVGGRGYVVYRSPTEPIIRSVPDKPSSLINWVAQHATGGGLWRYLGNSSGHWLGSVCSSTCNSALVAANIHTGFADGSFVMPSALVRSPALVRIGTAYIP